ncbi:hypothetical protein PGB90_004760 [Kerria lacca]
MNSKLLCFVLILFLYQVSAQTYDEAFKICKNKFSLKEDKPLDYFLVKGEFEPGYENLKADEKGLPKGEELKKLAQINKDKEELQLYADSGIQKACLGSKDQSSPCEATLNFVKCALVQKATQEKQTS